MSEADDCSPRFSWKEAEMSVPQVAETLPPVEAIRRQFLEIAASGSDDSFIITAEDIAKHWLQKVPGHVLPNLHFGPRDEEVRRERRARLGLGVGMQQKQAIALRVAQLMQDAGSSLSRGLDMEHWIHLALVAESGLPFAAMTPLLAKAVKKNARFLCKMQELFEAADQAHRGSVRFDEIAEVYRKRLWNVVPEPIGPEKALTLEESQLINPEEVAKRTIEAMDFNGDGRVSYPEFMAYSLGRRKQEVLLHMYDLSNNGAKSLSPWLIGKQIEGVWHTGVVAFGKEYYYSKDTVHTDAGDTVFGKPHRVLHMGYTFWRKEELHQHITSQLKPIFQRDTYDVICNNCNTFSDAVLMYLVGAHVPDEVMRQPELLLQAQPIRLIRPLLNWWLRDRIVVREDQKINSSSASRLKPEDQVPPGAIVSIHPDHGHGEPILGQVTTADAADLEQYTSCRLPGVESPATRAAQPLTSRPSGDDSCVSRSLGCSSWWSATCGAVQTAASGAGSSDCDRLWIQYFDVNIGPLTARPQVRVEHILRSRLSLGGLRADGQAIFNRVMKTLVDGEATRLDDAPLNKW